MTIVVPDAEFSALYQAAATPAASSSQTIKFWDMGMQVGLTRQWGMGAWVCRCGIPKPWNPVSSCLVHRPSGCGAWACRLGGPAACLTPPWDMGSWLAGVPP